jgi:FdhD protein
MLTVVVNGEELVRLSASPVHCQELAIGFLFSEGIVTERADISGIEHDPATGRVCLTLRPGFVFDASSWANGRLITSGCGQGVSLGGEIRRLDCESERLAEWIEPEYFRQLFALMKEVAVWHERTGCVHQALLATPDGPPIVREDIGRHNAVDKVLGTGLNLGVQFSHAVLACTGRISSDMVRKAGRAGVPVVVSRAAPTSLAIDLAAELGMTLVGFVRGRRINVYAHPERLRLQRQGSAVSC